MVLMKGICLVFALVIISGFISSQEVFGLTDPGTKEDKEFMSGVFLIGFSIIMPTINGIIGVLVATLLGLSLGGAVMFGLLLASASFIAAPAVLRHAIPQAKPSLYITSALGITFPYNIIVLLPIMFMISSIVHDVEGSIDLFNNFLEGI